MARRKTRNAKGIGLHEQPVQEFTKPAKRWWIEWEKPLGRPECPYAFRWLIGTPFGSIRMHRWLSSDDGRAMHDHPWWFLTCVISGEYIDISSEREEKMTPGTIRFRPALWKHWVKVVRPCTTILITGPEIRHWGMWVKGKWVKANKYFFRHGHHQCES